MKSPPIWWGFFIYSFLIPLLNSLIINTTRRITIDQKAIIIGIQESVVGSNFSFTLPVEIGKEA